MKLYPSQVAMYLFIGEELPIIGRKSLSDRVSLGREMLLKLSENDFGSNARDWHMHLLKEDTESYEMYGVHKDIESKLDAALSNREWANVVRDICF